MIKRNILKLFKERVASHWKLELLKLDGLALILKLKKYGNIKDVIDLSPEVLCVTMPIGSNIISEIVSGFEDIAEKTGIEENK